MAIILYCSNCNRVIMILRRLRPYSEVWELVIKRTGGKCPYCGYRFTQLDIKHVNYSVGDKVSKGMEVALNTAKL